jgi:hypothetical protein
MKLAGKSRYPKRMEIDIINCVGAAHCGRPLWEPTEGLPYILLRIIYRLIK